MASDDIYRPPPKTWRPEWEPIEEATVATGPRWRRDGEPTASPQYRRKKRLRLTVYALITLFCAGLLVYVCFWLSPPQPAALLLIGAGYEDNLAVPPNVYGRESMTALADLTRTNSASFIRRAGLIRLKQEPLELRRDSSWDANLDAFSEKTLVVYFALHGGCDSYFEKDKRNYRLSPYLLPHDADARDDEKNRLRLTAVIDRLSQLPPNRNKLLVLDATQINADWTMGMLHNDFARGLRELEPQIEAVPNLVVLCASDLDQRSWVSDDWRSSVFAHYLVEGLRGAADPENTGRVDAWKLHQFVRGSVENWVRINREALQTPLLLPEGSVGEHRASNMYLTMVQEPYHAAEADKVPPFSAPLELQQGWETYRRLSAQVPAPAVYSPDLWRQYQAVLLRYEQLLMLGDQANAPALGARLSDLAREVEQQRRLDLLSVQNTLAMPAVGGLVGEPARLVAMFNDLWDAPPAEVRTKWTAIQKSATGDSTTRRLLPLKMTDLLIDRAAENPVNNLDKAYQLLQVVSDPVRPRPTEAHFLAMLHRDLAQKPLSPELALVVQLALRVRRQAERTALAVDGNVYPYSELVASWTATRVAEADRQRRQGEDLLFASDSASWKRAAQFLDSAGRLYDTSGRTAEAIRYALGVRDQLLSMLPHYSWWLAQRRLAPSRERADTQLFLSTEDLWEQTHRLVALLEPGAAAQAKPGVTDPTAIRDLAASLEKKYRALQTQWTESSRESAAVDSPAAWRDVHDALAVPVPEPQLRMQMLNNSRRISRELLIRTPQNDAKAVPVTAETNRLRAQAQARRHGQMALAVLGPRFFDSLHGHNRETLQEVAHRLSEFAVEDQWWISLNRAGDQVGQRCRQLPVEIQQLVTHSRDPKSTRPQSLAALRNADRLGRQLTASAAVFLKEHPGDLFHRWMVQDLLLSQAQRGLDDHWYAEDEDAKAPYYRVAGQLYLEDALRVVPKQQPQPTVTTLQGKVLLPGELVLSNPPPVMATSESAVTVEYKLQAAAGAEVPPGQPVFWVEPEKGLKAEEPAPGQRLVRSFAPDKATEPIRFTLTGAALDGADGRKALAPMKERVQMRARGLFRGQRIERQTPVDLYPMADIIVSQPPLPDTGSLAVRGVRELHSRLGAATGAVAIVLDCSGSMGEEPGTPFTPKTKYNEVTRALEAMLKRVPKGTTVSLWVFGQAMGGGKVVEDAERTVRRIQDPVPWDGTDEDQVKRLMARVRYPALEPWNESPIVRTILMAKEDVKDVPGFKTILVLTDGMDNRFAKDKQMNPKGRSIPEVLREQFKDTGISINVIGFKVVSREEAAAAKQFRVIQDLSPPGVFLTVNDVEQLTFSLGKAVHQTLRYWVDREDNITVSPREGLDISKVGSDDQWFPGGLQPGGYKVRTYTPNRLQKSVVIQPSDLLMVQLLDGGSGLVFRRGLFSRDDYPGKPWQSKANWRLAVLQNQRIGDRGLQMLATLEKAPDQEESILQVIKPRETWIELKPMLDSSPRYSVRWTPQPGYPAPAWGLDVPGWPMRAEVQSPALPVLRVWWSPDLEAPVSAAVDRGPNRKTLLGLANETVSIDGNRVVIDGVDVEKHYVETRPGKRELQSCLVVRVGHAPGQPIRVKPRGLHLQGQEHRYYTEAGKYTGLFWPVTEKEAGSALESLGLISVNAFKREAEQRGFYLQMDKLGPPQASDVRPRPLELK